MDSLEYFSNKYQTMYIQSNIYKDCSGTYPYDQVIPYEVLTKQYANITNISEIRVVYNINKFFTTQNLRFDEMSIN